MLKELGFGIDAEEKLIKSIADEIKCSQDYNLLKRLNKQRYKNVTTIS